MRAPRQLSSLLAVLLMLFAGLAGCFAGTSEPDERARPDDPARIDGAGSQGNAVNGAYHIEVVIAYRDHGDGAGPVPAA